MIAKWKLLTLIGLTFAGAAGQNVGLTLSPEVQKKLKETAEKSCNDDLDRGRFGNYGSIDECVADKTSKLEHSYTASQSVIKATTGSQSHQPQ
jgi:hypothetical protein